MYVHRRLRPLCRVPSSRRERVCWWVVGLACWLGEGGRSVEKRHLSFRGRRAASVRYCASPGGHPFATIATAAAARPSVHRPTERRTTRVHRRRRHRSWTWVLDRRTSAESVSPAGRATLPPLRARRAVRAYTSATVAVGEEATHEELLHDGGGGAHHHHRRLLRRRRRSGLVVTVSGRRFVVP